MRFLYVVFLFMYFASLGLIALSGVGLVFLLMHDGWAKFAEKIIDKI